MNTSMISRKAFKKTREYFRDKVVWITGASSGIGEQLSLLLSEFDAKLIMSARSVEGLNRVKQEINCDTTHVHILPLDLESSESLTEKIHEALSIYGRIDILINNAGLGMRDFALNTELNVDRKIMNVNYFGTLALTKAALPKMISRKSGHIVVISSM